MLPTVPLLSVIAGVEVNAKNAGSVIIGLQQFGSQFGLDKPHRLAHYLAQIMHESGRFRYDREVWGPTAAQKRYEGREDLGNTHPGDGKKFAGHGPIQITGRHNTAAFRDWCRNRGFDAPDFEADPELINTDPWEGLGPIWYWSTRNLNDYADANNIEQITKRINGGLNGYQDRIDLYVRCALVLLGYDVDDVREFQQAHGLEVDGDPGPITRAAMHKQLALMAPDVATKDAPVTQDVPVVPEGADKRAGNWFNSIWLFILANAGAFMDLPWQAKVAIFVLSAGSVAFLIWRGEIIIRRIKTIVAEIRA